jgi:hypothetical protein
LSGGFFLDSSRKYFKFKLPRNHKSLKSSFAFFFDVYKPATPFFIIPKGPGNSKYEEQQNNAADVIKPGGIP